jgi:hypothetical protein
MDSGLSTGTDWLPRRDELLAMLMRERLTDAMFSSSSGTFGSADSYETIEADGRGQLLSSEKFDVCTEAFSGIVSISGLGK